MTQEITITVKCGECGAETPLAQVGHLQGSAGCGHAICPACAKRLLREHSIFMCDICHDYHRIEPKSWLFDRRTCRERGITYLIAG